MALLVILACIFAAVALMVILGERFAKPMDEKQQAKIGKYLPILIFIMLFAALFKEML